MADPRVALERQDRERTGGQKMLLRAPAVIALVRDCGDDARLRIAPAMAGDVRAFTDLRARAIGGDQQTRREFGTVGQLHADSLCGIEIGNRGGSQFDAGFLRLHDKRGEQRRVLDHMRERLARLDIAIEGEKDGPHHVVEAAVGDVHAEDRLRQVGNRIPHSKGLKQPTRRGDDCRCAHIRRWTPERRIDHHDRERWAERLSQRNRQREAGETGAADQHVDAPCTLSH